MGAAMIMPHFRTMIRLHAEEHRLPQDEVGELAHLDRADAPAAMPCASAGLIVYLAR